MHQHYLYVVVAWLVHLSTVNVFNIYCILCLNILWSHSLCTKPCGHTNLNGGLRPQSFIQLIQLGLVRPKLEVLPLPYSRWAFSRLLTDREGHKPLLPFPKSVTHTLQRWNMAVVPYLKKIQIYINYVTHPTRSAVFTRNQQLLLSSMQI